MYSLHLGMAQIVPHTHKTLQCLLSKSLYWGGEVCVCVCVGGGGIPSRQENAVIFWLSMSIYSCVGGKTLVLSNSWGL